MNSINIYFQFSLKIRLDLELRLVSFYPSAFFVVATWHQFQERAVIFCSIDPQGQKASNLAVPHGLRGGRHGQIVLPGE